MFDKIDVNGRRANPLFKFLRLNSRLQSGRIGWNFGKFLIDRQGNVVEYFGPGTNPLGMREQIYKLLQ